MPQFRYDPKKGSFKQWLLLITRRRIHDHLRRVYRSLPMARDESEGRGFEQVPSAMPAPDEQIDAAWEQEWQDNILQAALLRVRQRVNPKAYQVFDYCVLQAMPVRQAAKMLGLNAAQVYLAKHRVSASIKRAVRELELAGSAGLCESTLANERKSRPR
jgi:RNA polymerase sigma-70 factor (ECF subfamily)